MVSPKTLRTRKAVDNAERLTEELMAILDGKVYSFNERIQINGIESDEFHITAVLVKRDSVKPEYEVSIELFYHYSIQTFIEAMDIKCMADFYSINDKKIWEQFQNAKAELNLLDILDNGFYYNYTRVGKSGLEIRYSRPGTESGAVELDIKKFESLEDYQEHQRIIHHRLHG